jgi:hypothetical protein
VLSHIQVGSPDQLSTISLRGGRIDANIQGVEVGGGSSVRIGDHTTAEIGGALRTGHISARNFDPSDVTSAGSSVQVRNIRAENLVYNDREQALVMRRGAVDRVFAEGLGGGQVMAGASGVTAGSMSYSREVPVRDANGRPTGRTERRKQFGGNDIYVTCAYATLQQGQGQNWSVVEGRVIEAGGRQLRVNSFPTGEQRQAQAGPAGPRPELNLDAIRHMGGHLNLSVDFPTLLSDRPTLGRILGHGQLNIPIRDGAVRVADIELAVRGIGVSGEDLAWVVGRIAQTMSGNTLPTAEIAAAASHFPIPVATMGELANRHAGGSGGGGPSPRLGAISIDAQFQNLGGNISYGDQFRGRVDDGGSVSVSGNVGRDMTVRGNNLGMSHVTAHAGGGTVTAGRVAMENGTVQVVDIQSGAPAVRATINDGRVRHVRYFPPGNTRSRESEAAYRRQTQGE